MDLLRILRRESMNTGQIYLYEERGRWYAYEQSAYLISQMITKTIRFSRQISNHYSVELVKAELESDVLFDESYDFISCSDGEMVLAYRPSSECLSRWISTIPQG